MPTAFRYNEEGDIVGYVHAGLVADFEAMIATPITRNGKLLRCIQIDPTATPLRDRHLYRVNPQTQRLEQKPEGV